MDRFLNRLFVVVALVAIAGVWTWWALDAGGYFDVVFYPGAILLLAVVVVLLRGAPWEGRLTRPVIVAAVALALLAVTIFASVLWTPAPDAAVSDAHRVALYGVAFGLGLWGCHLLRRRMALALLPLALAGGITGLVTLLAAATADSPSPLIELGVLERPLGYHNANAAFFAIAFFAAIGLATDRDRDWRLRGTMVGTATVCAGLLTLSQSRGSVLAGAAGIVVFVALSRDRLRSALYLAAALIPAAVVAPILLDVYSRAADDGDVLGALHLAAAALGVAGVLAALAGGAMSHIEAGLRPSPRTVARVERALAALVAIAVIGGSVVLVGAAGNPVDWVNQRFTEFKQGGDPELGGSRFAFNAGSERYDYWRVALDQWSDNPAVGRGAGTFEYAYLIAGRSNETPRDAHSVELELLSEQGIVGLALFVVFLAAAVVGALRSRRLGPAAAVLCATALAICAYWLVHASIEWFWTYPAVTAPVFALLGAACAPAILWPGHRAPRAGRFLLGAGAVVIGLSMLPPFLSQRYTNAAYSSWRNDLQGAYEALDRAQKLNPYSDAPLLAEGAIARREGDVDRALDAFRAASERKPEAWVGHYYLGLLLARDDPAAARRQLDLAQELNPRGDTVERALEQLRRQGGAAPTGI